MSGVAGQENGTTGARRAAGATGSGSVTRRILLGSQLRRLRESRGVTREAAGYAIRASESKISRMELGRVSIKPRDVEDLLTLSQIEASRLEIQPEAIDLRQVVRAASTDIGGTPVITGVLLTAEDGGLRIVATDKYRLAIRDIHGAGVLADGQQVIVHARALGELQRLLG